MRPFLTRRLLGALAGAAIFGVAACQPAEQGAVDVAVIGKAPELRDPAGGPLDFPSAVLVANAAQGLVRFDARGQIEPGLAERWNVSDDGLSYIFRLAAAEWPGGGRITAEQVARVLRRQIAGSSRNPMKDTLGAVAEIVAMTDRVIEIRLRSPRPNLLQLLAQPEMGIVRDGAGSGPFAINRVQGDEAGVRLTRTLPAEEGVEPHREDILLAGLPVRDAVRGFMDGSIDLVLGGTFADLPVVRGARVPNDQLVFDPAAGLFGLAVVDADGLLADAEVRRLLSQAIDRDAFVTALNVPGLAGRATLLEPGLADAPEPAAPEWLATPIGDRRPDLIAAADGLLPDAESEDEGPTLRLFLPDGPGSEYLLRLLARDWGLLGITVERAETRAAADLALVDEVAPSTSAAWYLRRFRCGASPVCDEEIDELLESARAAPVGAQRAALLAEAARRTDELQPFIPLAAPIRWSLVADRVEGFAGNRFARHTLTGLGERLTREGPE